jgi:hypothetical protein
MLVFHSPRPVSALPHIYCPQDLIFIGYDIDIVANGTGRRPMSANVNGNGDDLPRAAVLIGIHTVKPLHYCSVLIALSVGGS